MQAPTLAQINVIFLQTNREFVSLFYTYIYFTPKRKFHNCLFPPEKHVATDTRRQKF